MIRVLVDTSAFVALNDNRDQFHDRATAYYEELNQARIPLLSTTYVLNETHTWLQRHPNFRYPAARFFGERFKRMSSPAALPETTANKGRGRPVLTPADPKKPIVLLYTTPVIEDAAWDYFGKHGACGATYTDCVSFAVMKMLGIKQAFTFDEHFAAAGFERVP